MLFLYTLESSPSAARLEAAGKKSPKDQACMTIKMTYSEPVYQLESIVRVGTVPAV
jgi:hypothetical protein